MMKIYLFISGLLGVTLQFFYASRLPATVANHFGFGGRPNGWMSNEANLVLGISMYVLITSLFLSMPVVLRKSPLSIINFPKKSYWLAPERKAASIPLIASWLQFMGVATNLFLLIVFHLVYLANTRTPPHLNERIFLNSLVAYLVIAIGWLIALYNKFNKIPVTPK